MTVNTILNPREPSVVANLYSYYNVLREFAPVHWEDELQAWICTDHHTCQHVLRNPDLFTADPRKVGVDIPDSMIGLQALDPPDHTSLRQLFAAAFRAQDMAEFEKDYRLFVRDTVQRLPVDGQVDLTAELLTPVTLRAVCDFLGVSVPELSWFTDVSERLFRGIDGGYVPEAMPNAMRAREELSTLVTGWLDEGSDRGLVGFVGDKWRDQSIARSLLANTVRAIFLVGHTTTRLFMENAVLTCLQHSHVKSAIRGISGTDAMRTAIDELLRFDGPVQVESRFCAVDTRLGDQEIRKGEAVTVLLGAANRDPAVFDRPEQILLDRKPNPHLGFGRGIHSCLGAGLALLEAKVVLEELLEAYPHVSLAAQPVRRLSGTFRGVSDLPVWLQPRLTDVAGLIPRGASSRAILAKKDSGT